jgi:hypothetical protein
MSSKANVLHPDPVKRAESMHDIQSAGEWNFENIEAAKAQSQNPIMGLIKGVKNGVSNVLRSTVKLGADIITHPIATVVNTGQWIWDVATKLPARGLLIASDTVSKGVFGNISKWTRQIREKIHAVMEPKTAGHGGHGHDAHGDTHEAAHGGGHAPPAHH